MKFLVVFSVALACVVADVAHLRPDEFNAPILKSEYESSPEGAFQYAYETGNGISAQAQGVVNNPKNEYPSIQIQGGYRYTAPDGQVVDTTYVANELGYQPQGSHLPTSPPIPEPILRSLEYISAHPPAVEGSKIPYKPAYSG